MPQIAVLVTHRHSQSVPGLRLREFGGKPAIRCSPGGPSFAVAPPGLAASWDGTTLLAADHSETQFFDRILLFRNTAIANGDHARKDVT
jgi:hypothetical protein